MAFNVSFVVENFFVAKLPPWLLWRITDSVTGAQLAYIDTTCLNLHFTVTSPEAVLPIKVAKIAQ